MKNNIWKFTLLKTILISLFLSNGVAIAQVFDWTNHAGSGSGVLGEDVTIDQWGNIYGIGSCVGSTNFIDTNVTNSNSQIFLVKYNRLGERKWLKTISSSSNCNGYNIKTDLLGNVYTVYKKNSAIYLSKFDPYGNLIWQNPVPGTGFKTGLDVDAYGNSYVTFTSATSGFFGNIYLDNSTGWSDVGYGKFDTNGNAQWVDLILGSTASGALGIDISINPETNLLGLTGQFYTTSIGAIINPLDGSFISEILPVSGFPKGQCILSANNGNYIVGGIFQGTVNFGNTTLIANGSKDIFLASYNINGTENWVRHIYGIAGNTQNYLITDINEDRNGNYFICGRFAETGVFGSDTITAMGVMDAFISKFDSSGNYYWTRNMGCGGDWDIADNLDVDSNGIIAITGDFASQVGIFGNDTLSFLGTSNMFISRFIGNANLVTGNVFVDYNNNSQKDSIEPYFVNRFISASPSDYFAMTNTDGNYYLHCDTGTFIIKPIPTPLYHTIYPDSIIIDFPTYGLQDSLYDFRVIPIPNIVDIEADLTSFRSPRPGLDLKYQLTYKNIGTDTISGTIILKKDTLFSFVSADSIPLSITGDSLVWQYSDLKPEETGTIILYLHLSSIAQIGDTLLSTIQITPVIGDTVTLNNYDTLSEIIINSYDPNDKSVVPNNDVFLPFVQNQNYFEYLIRFQNTGTDTAYNIVISDTISQLFDITSFEIISSSHSYEIIFVGNRCLFEFSNIYLPDSGTSNLESQGFIKYRIRPKNDLMIGDEFLNTAFIYFDFNTPVVTNTTSTLILGPVGFYPAEPIDLPFIRIYPNPSHMKITIETSAIINMPYEITDLNGKIIQNGKINTDIIQLDLSGLSAGLYLFRTGNETIKIIKQ